MLFKGRETAQSGHCLLFYRFFFYREASFCLIMISDDISCYSENVERKKFEGEFEICHLVQFYQSNFTTNVNVTLTHSSCCIIRYDR